MAIVGRLSRKDDADIRRLLAPIVPEMESLKIPLLKPFRDFELSLPLTPEPPPPKPKYPLRQEITCDDCLNVMKAMPDSVVDLVIADPPYFKIHGKFDYEWKTADEYIEWCRTWIKEVRRVLRPTGTFYLWGVMGYGLGWSLPRICQWIEENNLFTVRNWITLAKSRGRGTKRGYMSVREECVFMTVGKRYTWNTAYTGVPTRRKDRGQDGKPRRSTFRRVPDVWDDISEASQSSRQRIKLPDGTTFPTVKPDAACERIIRASSNVGDLLLIPFAGSGTEVVVAKRLHRQFIAVEKDAEYFPPLKERFEW